MAVEHRRVAWSITGSGHYLRECLELAERLPAVDLFLSRTAAEVLQVSGFPVSELKARFRLFRDTTASAPPVGLFYAGQHKLLVVAPATSNSVAKMVYGISDTLVTNVYAQAGKCRIPSIVFACDTAPEMETQAPGRMVKVYPRPIDLESTERLAHLNYTSVVTTRPGSRRPYQTIDPHARAHSLPHRDPRRARLETRPGGDPHPWFQLGGARIGDQGRSPDDWGDDPSAPWRHGGREPGSAARTLPRRPSSPVRSIGSGYPSSVVRRSCGTSPNSSAPTAARRTCLTTP